MSISDRQNLVGRTVVGPDGENIGKVEELYLDTDSQQPEWVSVTTGFFGSHRSLVPLAKASEEGSDLRIPYGKEQVKAAPHYDPARELSQKEEADVFRHYGLGGMGQGSQTAATRHRRPP